MSIEAIFDGVRWVLIAVFAFSIIEKAATLWTRSAAWHPVMLVSRGRRRHATTLMATALVAEGANQMLVILALMHRLARPRNRLYAGTVLLAGRVRVRGAYAPVDQKRRRRRDDRAPWAAAVRWSSRSQCPARGLHRARPPDSLDRARDLSLLLEGSRHEDEAGLPRSTLARNPDLFLFSPIKPQGILAVLARNAVLAAFTVTVAAQPPSRASVAGVAFGAVLLVGLAALVAGLDAPFEDVGQELLDVRADRGGSAVQVDA